MRTKRWLLVLSLAVVVAGAATTAGVLLTSGSASSRGQHELAFTKGDPDAAAAGNREDAANQPNEQRSPDSTYEAQQGEINAYPAESVPFQATLDAQNAWAALVARSAKASSGAWQLIGPDKATYPGVLNVLGDGAQYVTSGRVTALALVGNSCTTQNCTLLAAAAGGGVWKTTKALSGNPGWTFTSGSFLTNAIGSLVVDPNDPSHQTVYAATGEPNASADSEAGMGIYKSTDGGSTWSFLSGSSLFQGRSLASIQIAPNGDILVGVTRGVRGAASVSNGGATTSPPVAAALGLYRSTNGGASFSQIWNGAGSIRGVNEVRVDPSNPSILYAGAFQVGVWRSSDNGATWTQIKTPLNGAQNTDRPEFAVTKLPNGKTRMYVGIGNAGAPAARFWRTDDAQTATNASFVDLTTAQNQGYCTGQCWYDNVVYSPPGQPDMVYLLGSFDYGTNGGSTNARGVLLSTDAGVTFTDMTKDADPNHSESIHPDMHAIVVNPANPLQFFEGSDGGVVRTDGNTADISSKCDSRGLSAAGLALCKSLLSRVPNQIVSLNEGLSTLQFQSLSVSPKRPQNNLQGGTQDNGTFQFTGSKDVAYQEIYGDGGQSGYSAADDGLRFNTFTGQATDVNFRNGDPTKWVIATGPIVSSPEGSYFYPPVTADPNPANGGTIFQGSQSVWRTQDWGGNRDYLEANCPEFTTSAAAPNCGDFTRIGPAGATDLTAASYGSRAGTFVAAIERAPSNTGTLWVATGAGRVFVSDNADAAAGAVTFTRIDTLAANSPGRFVSSIYVDPSNPHHAWISYSGYNFNTPAQPGHVFEVTYTGATATWTNLDGGTGPLGDLPVTDLVRDDVTGTLYAATDFGVASNSGSGWAATPGLPMVATPGLTIVPSARVLYAATHGRGAWQLNLP